MSFFSKLGDELGGGIGRGINSLVSWIFRWEKKSGEHQLHTNTARIALWSICLALFFVPGLVTCSFTKTDNSQTPSTVRFYVQLGENVLYAFPSNEHFKVITKEGASRYTIFGDYALYSYKEQPTIVTAIQKTCVMVPAGKEIRISSLTAPVFVVNMEGSVNYFKRQAELNFFQKIYTFFLNIFLGIESYPTSNSWKHLREHWSEVDFKNFSIRSKALSKKNIIDNVDGGFVCF